MPPSTVPYRQHLSDVQAQQIRELLSSSEGESELFGMLGRSMGASATGEDPETRGRAVFKRRIRDLRAVLCSDPLVKAYCNDPIVSDVTNIAYSVAGALTVAQFQGVNVLLIGAIVARIGLRSVCLQE